MAATYTPPSYQPPIFSPPRPYRPPLMTSTETPSPYRPLPYRPPILSPPPIRRQHTEASAADVMNVMRILNFDVCVPNEDITEIALIPCDNTEHNDCSICIDSIDGTSGGKLECGHTFHNECIKSWFSRGKTTCPYCRSTLDLNRYK